MKTSDVFLIIIVLVSIVSGVVGFVHGAVSIFEYKIHDFVFNNTRRMMEACTKRTEQGEPNTIKLRKNEGYDYYEKSFRLTCEEILK